MKKAVALLVRGTLLVLVHDNALSEWCAFVGVAVGEGDLQVGGDGTAAAEYGTETRTTEG